MNQQSSVIFGLLDDVGINPRCRSLLSLTRGAHMLGMRLVTALVGFLFFLRARKIFMACCVNLSPRMSLFLLFIISKFFFFSLCSFVSCFPLRCFAAAAVLLALFLLLVILLFLLRNLLRNCPPLRRHRRRWTMSVRKGSVRHLHCVELQGDCRMS